MQTTPIYVGIAGWSIPRPQADLFPGAGTHLQRLSRRLNAAEINTTFYRPHQPKTYARWAAVTPPDFRFSVKAPRAITHHQRLTNPEPLAQFLEEVQHLGEKLGPLLFQLPPSLRLNLPAAAAFFGALRSRWTGPVVCEPRHPSWFTPQAEALFIDHQISRVAADPARVPAAAHPAGWPGLAYYRLHGSPEIYNSPYPPLYLAGLADTLLTYAQSGVETWCIFDNTAVGFAQPNALQLRHLLTKEAQAAE